MHLSELAKRVNPAYDCRTMNSMTEKYFKLIIKTSERKKGRQQTKLIKKKLIMITKDEYPSRVLSKCPPNS